MNTCPEIHPGGVTRRDAAVLLRAARNTPLHRAEERIDWALAVIPASLPALRLKIDHLLHGRHVDLAHALVARCLATSPDKASLLLRRARCCLLRGDLEQAYRDVHLAIAHRPNHIRSLMLAADVAALQDNRQEQLSLLSRALQTGRRQRTIRIALVNAMIEHNDPKAARDAFDQIPAPPHLLHARLLRSEGRLLDAADVIRREALPTALRHANTAAHDEALVELISLVEQVGNTADLAAIAEDIPPGRPAALDRAVRAMLALGGFEHADALIERLTLEPGAEAIARRLRIVTRAMTGRIAEAEQELADAELSCGQPEGRRHLIDAWRRGLRGRLLMDQRHARVASVDPDSSLLQPLLRRADTLFRESLEREDAHLTRAEQTELLRHRAVCLLALGQPREAAMRFAEALQLEEQRSALRRDTHRTAA